MAELSDRVTQLEDEMKIIKNEVQAVLLDLRESYLQHENPFHQQMPTVTTQPIVINQESPRVSRRPAGEGGPEEDGPRDAAPPAQEADAAGADAPPASVPGPAATGPGPETEIGDSATVQQAPEEVKGEWHTATDGGPLPAGSGDGQSAVRLAIETMAELADWVVAVAGRLGIERTQVLLDIAETMGHLPREFKGILDKIVTPIPDEKAEKVTIRDYLAALKELDEILGKGSKSELALLSILCQGSERG